MQSLKVTLELNVERHVALSLWSRLVNSPHMLKRFTYELSGSPGCPYIIRVADVESGEPVCVCFPYERIVSAAERALEEMNNTDKLMKSVRAFSQLYAYDLYKGFCYEIGLEP